MKQKLISVCSIVIVLVLILVSMKYFRNGNPFAKQTQMKAENETKEPKQDGKIEKKSKEFAKKVEAAMDKQYSIDPAHVVPMGKKMKEGPLTYKVLSWEITKQKPDYPLPDEMTPPEEYMTDKNFGAEFDEEGNFLNEFSYVIVNIEAENSMDRPTEGFEFTWKMFGLKSVGIYEGGSWEVQYLGEESPREYNKQYGQEALQPHKPMKMALIYIIEDTMLEGDGFFLEVNRGGSIPEDRIEKFYTTDCILMLE